MPKVSVIMGIYNCEKTLKLAIDSVFMQTFTDWELIMCDDASTDQTANIAEEYVKKYPEKVILLRNIENKKLAYSLNRCLEVAKGEYIARMDADDLNLPTRYEKQVEFLNQHSEYSVVSCRAIIFDEHGNRGIRENEGEPSKDCILTGLPFMHPTIMMRKSAYDLLGGYTVARWTDKGQDANLWFKFTAAGMRGYTLGEPLYKYHESISDLKRRTLRQAFYRSKNRYIGYRMIKAPLRYYPLVLKPIIAALIPNFILYARRNRIEKQHM